MSYALDHCGKKEVYYTITQARKAAREKKLKYGNVLFPYECQFCNFFHLSTSKSKRKRYYIRGIGEFWRGRT